MARMSKLTSPTILVGLVLILVIFLRKTISDLLDKFSSGALNKYDAERISDGLADMDKLYYNPAKLRYSEIALKEVADEQYQAMVGAGTNEELLFRTIPYLNADELIYIYIKFGIKSETYFFVPVFTGNLFGWYNAEFSSESEDYKKLKGIWKKTGLWV